MGGLSRLERKRYSGNGELERAGTCLNMVWCIFFFIVYGEGVSCTHVMGWVPKKCFIAIIFFVGVYCYHIIKTLKTNTHNIS
jgi:hypothetical protein